MFISEAFSKDGQLSIAYEDSGSSYSIKSSEAPKPSLTEAMRALTVVLFRNLEIPDPEAVDKDYADDLSYKDVRRQTARLERRWYSGHFSVIGASHSYSEQNGDKYKVIGLYKTASGSLTVKTSAMSVPEQGASFWNANKPAEYPGFLTPEDVIALETFFDEAEAFINGERDQKEMFDKDGNPKEGVENKAEEEPEKPEDQPEFFESEENSQEAVEEAPAEVEDNFVDFGIEESDEDF